MNATDLLSCQDVEALIPLVAEGLIDPDQDSAVYDHLAVCECCQNALYTHDMITLNLSHGHEIQTTKHNQVIHFHISRTLASAAAILILACGAAMVNLGFNQVDPVNSPTPLALQEPETQILEVLPSQSGDDMPLIILRHQDQTMVIRQDQIDSGTDSKHVNANIPVNVRY